MAKNGYISVKSMKSSHPHNLNVMDDLIGREIETDVLIQAYGPGGLQRDGPEDKHCDITYLVLLGHTITHCTNGTCIPGHLYNCRNVDGEHNEDTAQERHVSSLCSPSTSPAPSSLTPSLLQTWGIASFSGSCLSCTIAKHNTRMYLRIFSHYISHY